MAGSRYVLCEYSHDSEYAYIYQMTQELVLHGYIPVFAHVERYGALADLQLAEELRNLGAWITVNADAVLGLEGMGPKKYCKKMLKAECVDAIASDSHGIKNRANHMGKCYELIEKKIWQGICGSAFGESSGKDSDRRNEIVSNGALIWSSSYNRNVL